VSLCQLHNAHGKTNENVSAVTKATFNRLVRQQRLPSPNSSCSTATLRSFLGHLLEPKEKDPSNNNNNTALGSECLYS